MSNMLFLSTNYLEFSSISGTYMNTSTAQYLYDNRSDAGYLSFTTSTGMSVVIDLGATITIDTFMILDYSMRNTFYPQFVDAGGTSTSFVGSVGGTTSFSSWYYNGTLTARIFSIAFDSQTSTPLIGEIFIGNQRFRLNTNPNMYTPMMTPVGGEKNTTYDGKGIFTRVNSIFSADIGWDYLRGDLNSMTGTDLQNITELVRGNKSFIFYGVGGSATSGLYPDIYTWRPSDIFKCKFTDAVTYELSIKSRLDTIRARYTMMEVK